MNLPCACGGETQLEHYDHPYGVQWFLRCLACERMSQTAATSEGASLLPIESISEAKS